MLKRKELVIVLVIDLIVLMSVFFRTYVFSTVESLFSPCFFAENGMLCPTCGGTRCVRAILSGDILSAFRYNAFALFAFVYGVFLLLMYNLYYIFGVKWSRRVVSILLNYKMLVIILSSFVIFGIVRNAVYTI